MNRDDLEDLLVAYGRVKRDTPILSNVERAQLQASIQSQPDSDDKQTRLPGSTTGFRGLVIWGTAAAAMIGVALLLPSPKNALTLRASTAGGLRTAERFEIQVMMSRPMYPYLILLDDRKTLSIIQNLHEVIERVDQSATLGSYPSRTKNTEGKWTLRTHAIVLGCPQPIEIEKLARVVPDNLEEGSTIQELCENLKTALGCEASQTSIPSN